jgi:predicted DNA-binding transcriptional regulator YafY
VAKSSRNRVTKNDVSGARRIALAVYLLSQWKNGGVTLETIVANLKSDGPDGRLTLSYTGDAEATRKKFQRDKNDLIDIGLDVRTMGGGGAPETYAIDPDSVFIGDVDFTESERNLVGAVLSMRGASAGLLGYFMPPLGPPSAMMENSHALQSLNHAIARGYAVRFRYQGKQVSERLLVPMYIHNDRGRNYVVGFEPAKKMVLGFRLSRMLDTPQEDGTAPVIENFRQYLPEAKEWRTSDIYEINPVTVTLHYPVGTGEKIAQLRGGTAKTTSRGTAVTLTFPSLEDAENAILEFGHPVARLRSKLLKQRLLERLKSVNNPGEASITIDDVQWPANARAGAGLVATTIAIAGSLYDDPEGLSAGEIGRRFGMSTNEAETLMNSLMSLADPMDHTKYLFNIHMEDGVEDDNDGPIYIRGAEGPDTIVDLGNYTWKDAFQIVVALKSSPFLDLSSTARSAIEALESAAPLHVTVAFEQPRYFNEFTRAMETGTALKVEYLSERAQAKIEQGIDVDLTYTLLPVDVKERLGIHYVNCWVIQGGSASEASFRSFRLDRMIGVLEEGIAVPAPNKVFDPSWLDNIGDGGVTVVIAVAPDRRWLFEGIPGAEWGTVKDGDQTWSVVRFPVSLPDWLDRLMVRAGRGAFVISQNFADAGRDLAEHMRKSLRSIL